MPERKAFLLRLDPGVHEALQGWAAADLRSLNGQIEFLLREALQRAGRLGGRGRVRAGEGGHRTGGGGMTTPGGSS